MIIDQRYFCHFFENRSEINNIQINRKKVIKIVNKIGAKNGAEIEELADFNQTESRIILHELAQIMSVYDGECSTPQK